MHGYKVLGPWSMSVADECKAMQETLQDRCVLRSRSLAWQRSIHERANRYSATSCRNRSAGAEAPRSELFVALRRRSMQYPEYRVPRIPLPRTPVNKPRRGSSEVTVVVVEAAPKHPILPDSSRIPNRLYLHSQRGLPVGV